MDFLASFKICSSGLSAQRAKMDVITSNLANMETTKTREGGPYRRKKVVFAAAPLQGGFGGLLDKALSQVKVEKVVAEEGVRLIFDPQHPDADERGMVAKPDVNLMEEMVEMLAASRNFEACVTAFDATKSMALKAMDIGK